MRWLVILFVLLLFGAPAQADVAPSRGPGQPSGRRRPVPEWQAPPAPSAPAPEPEPPQRPDEDVPWFLIGSMLVLALSGVHLFWPRRDAVLEKWGLDASPDPRRPEAK